jgi:hypothetical protein
MITAASILFFGFLFGVRHATDPDHVVAVTTIVSREKTIGKSAGIGAMWGLGHTLTLALLGGAIVWSGVRIPERVAFAFEFGVALMLIALGLYCLGNYFQRLRLLARDEFERSILSIRRGYLGSFCVGTVHGIAGSGALALLILPMVHDPLLAAGYLAVFGLGTIAGMVGITMAIAFPVSWTAQFSTALHRRIGLAAGFASITFGLFMAYQIAFVQGLFVR